MGYFPNAWLFTSHLDSYRRYLCARQKSVQRYTFIVKNHSISSVNFLTLTNLSIMVTTQTDKIVLFYLISICSKSRIITINHAQYAVR